MPMQPMPTIIGYGLPDSGASTLIVVKRLHSIIREQTGIARQPTQAQLNLNAKNGNALEIVKLVSTEPS